MLRRIKIKIKKSFSTKLNQDDLRGYRNILKLLYHPMAKAPLKHPDIPKYYIQVPKLHLDLIIDHNHAEIVNSKQIYPLNLHDKVKERALLRIRELVLIHRETRERQIKSKKQNILRSLYAKIN